MRLLAFLFCCFLLPLSCRADGATTQQQIEARLVHKQLFLRGMWAGEKLRFDEDGKLLGSGEVASFTLSGMDVRKVKLSPKKLELTGPRLGLLFDGLKASRVTLVAQEAGGNAHDVILHVEIAMPASGDFAEALDAVFASDIRDLVLPQYWQGFMDTLLKRPQATEKKTGSADGVVRPPGSKMTAPVALFTPEPVFNAYARGLRLSRIVLISLQVDTDGNPIHLRVARAVGVGLDECALDAVSKYRFKPATRDGQPVVVELGVEVNFQIF